MRSRRSVILRLSLCLLLGAVTTWLVAAAFAVWGPQIPPRQVTTCSPSLTSTSTGPYVLRRRLRGLGCEYREDIQWQETPAYPANMRTAVGRMVELSDPNMPPPGGWGQWPTATDEQLLAKSPAFWERGFGWPLLAFWHTLDPTAARTATAGRSGIELARFSNRPTFIYRSIPLLPIWPGLLLNTAFYGALWALPLFGLPLLNQARRRRKGRCPRCNYDLKRDLEHGCPECGWGK